MLRPTITWHHAPRAKRLNDAEASYRQATALKPDFAEAYNNLGITLKALGKSDDAEASYRQATALKPDYAEAHSNGCHPSRAMQTDEAEASLRQAIAGSLTMLMLIGTYMVFKRL